MSLIRRGALALVALLGGCVAARPSHQAPVVAPAPQPVYQGAPTPFPPPPPGSFERGGIIFKGALAQGGMLVGHAPPQVASLTLDGQAVSLAADDRFLIAFGRDHGPVAVLVEHLADGSARSVPLAITPGRWKIEALPIPMHRQPEAEFMAIRAGELAQIKAARETAWTVASDGWRQTFRWPAAGRITGAFGAQRIYNGVAGAYHSGEDIAVPTGTPVRAPADGVVVLAATGAPFTLEGHLLMVAHGQGLDSAFLHLSRIDVKVGDTVRQGQVIGASGMTGRATGPHLHWSLTWRGERIDPKLVAGAAG